MKLALALNRPRCRWYEKGNCFAVHHDVHPATFEFWCLCMYWFLPCGRDLFIKQVDCSPVFFSQKPPETLGLARCFRDVSSMPLQRSVTSMARIPRTDAAVGHCPFCTERFARWPHLTWDCDGTPQNEIQRPVRFHHYLSWRFSWAVKSQSETGRIAVLHWLMCAHKSFDGNECRLTRPWWMLHAQQGLAAPSYTACLVCLYRCFHAASPGILWNWLSRTCEEHVQGLLEQANWC